MATSSLSTLGLALRQQRSQLRNEKLLHDTDRATTGLPRVSTKRLELLKRQYLDLVAAEQKKSGCTGVNGHSTVPSAAPITHHESSLAPNSHPSPCHSPPSPVIQSNHSSPPPSDHKSSPSAVLGKLDDDVQPVDCSFSPSTSHDSPLSSPISHSSATHSSLSSKPSSQHVLLSPSNQCLLSPIPNSSSSSCTSPLPTSNHSPLLPNSSSLHQTPSPPHSPTISKQHSPTSYVNHTPLNSSQLPISSARHSKADESASDHSSSHLLSLLGEDSSSISSLSPPFTPDAVEKLVTNSSPVLMKVDKKTQEIKVEESLEEKVVNGQEEVLNSPVSNEETRETNGERGDKEIKQVEGYSKSVTEMSQKKDSTSVSSMNESDSEDFWASSPVDDLPLPEEKNEKKEKQNKRNEEKVEEEKAEMAEQKTEVAEEEEETDEEETDEEEADEEEADEEEMERARDHFSTVKHMLRSLNDRLRKDREEAKYLYMDGSPTDGMKGLIVSSKVLTAVLTRVSGEGCEISSWDSRAVAAVLREELREMVSSEGPLISRESSRQSLETFNDGLKTPWNEVWSLLVEHARLVFQCGQSLESVATAFSVLEGERNGVLQKLLEASCGVEQSWSANSKHDDTTTSSSSSGGQNGDHSKVPPAVSESDAYRSLLLQSSLVLSGELTSDEADTDIEQEMHKFSTSTPPPPVHHTLLVSPNEQTPFTRTSAQPNSDVSIASSISSSSAVSLPEVATSKTKMISASDVAKRTTMMKRMGLLAMSESESDIELQHGLNDTTEDFDFYS